MIPIPSEEMHSLDMNCRYFGLLPLQLMENAGAALAREVRAKAAGKKVAIVAGRGNNGGDAFVTARQLDGFETTTYLLGRSQDYLHRGSEEELGYSGASGLRPPGNKRSIGSIPRWMRPSPRCHIRDGCAWDGQGPGGWCDRRH